MDIKNFNTSHVVVYRTGEVFSEVPPQFQYISCCSLSSKVISFALENYHFNTSHVVVYRMSSNAPTTLYL